MTNVPRRYDSLLSGIETASLKKMAVLWGAKSKLPKDDCIHWIRTGLADPQQVDAAIARMRPYERAALGLLKLFGGAQDLHALCAAVRATGTLPGGTHKDRGYRQDDTPRDLVERGIVLSQAGYRYYSYSYSSIPVFTDERLLARVEPLEHIPLRVAVAERPTVTTARRAQSLVLDIIAMVRAVNDIGGLGRTKSGELRVTDLRKFARKMGWGEQIDYDGLPFPEPTHAYLVALASSGLLAAEGERLVAVAGLEQIGSRPAGELVRSLVGGILSLNHWQEYAPVPRAYLSEERAQQGRFVLLAALCCLPAPQGWFRFADFERALFDRIGEFFSIGHIDPFPFFYGKSQADERAEVEKWRRAVREDWEKTDVPWLQAAFRTWLYALGLVELSLTDGMVERFRLTEVGRAVLFAQAAPEAAQPRAEQGPAWVVQPNFDVVVYLADASTEQVAFLEQYAERVSMAQHTAQYRLTRDSVYEGLQRGMDADRLLAALAAGSRVELPGNVAAEIRSWAGLRERIIVRRQADLLEFPDAAARRTALDGGLTGTPVGERFLLVTPSAEAGVADLAPEVIDYTDKNPPRCLQVTEDGLVTLTGKRRDLFTPGYLDLWAERKSDTTWQLTRERVAEAVRRGRTYRELLTLLQDRLTHALPPLLKVALGVWAGGTIAAGLDEAVILQCAHIEAFEALLASPTLKPHLLGRIGPDALLVKSGSVSRVREILNWAGLQTSAKIVSHRY